MTVTAESSSRTVQTSRYRMHYYEAGEGHPVILLHGSGPGATGWSNFRPNIEPLSQHFHVYSVDMPGWGESETQNDAVGRDHVADLIAFMDELGIERAALVGNSMGGMTSVATSVRFPERVSHLISMGAPAPGLDLFSPGGGFSEGLKVLFHAYREPTAENMKKLVQIMCFDPEWATDELAALRSAAARAHPEHLDSWNALWDAPQAPNPYFALLPELSKLSVPTLALHGRDDRVVSFEHSLRFVAAIPTSRVHIINRCGHWLQIEHSEEFNRLVADFVSNS
ncbi:alpha/beta fold hydrolase [Nocardioides acrostichi]|uniref:Alpha/beta fold hydrolase n=1 Tax=Nocardioides acrostichi TaxID=2784339 RepID=A0A930V3V0_9ACTN|nr:alpha/beta hydrolase [Nocardioides acrostichi]MBF4162724.1 alpha/beta fold hydrolase [Nocardioides acrostichi]